MKKPQHVKFTREDLQESLNYLQLQLLHGCGNHGCVINQPKGLGTNSVCNCRPKVFVKTLLNLAMLTEEMGNEWVED